MGFLFHTIDGRLVPGTEYLACGAITPEVGLALYVNNGKLAVAAGTTKPTYICLRHEDAAVAAGTVIPVARVLPDTVFETTASASLASVNVGAKVTVSSDGLQVTGTTEGGTAEIVSMDGTAAGSVVRVRFA